MKTFFALLIAMVFLAIGSVPASAYEKASPGIHWSFCMPQHQVVADYKFQYMPALAEVEIQCPLIENKMLVSVKTALVSIKTERILFQALRPPGNKVFV